MCAIPSLGAKEEIKRQRIKFSDSELDLANTETNGGPYSLWHFPLQFCLSTMAQEQKLNNVEGRWLGNIYEHFSLKLVLSWCTGSQEPLKRTKQYTTANQ